MVLQNAVGQKVDNWKIVEIHYT